MGCERQGLATMMLAGRAGMWLPRERERERALDPPRLHTGSRMFGRWWFPLLYSPCLKHGLPTCLPACLPTYQARGSGSPCGGLAGGHCHGTSRLIAVWFGFDS